MLTSAARETLAEVQTVIVDEVHAVAAHQTRRAPGAVAGAARPAVGHARAAHRAVGDRAAARGGGAVPVRAGADDDRRAARGQDVRPVGAGARVPDMANLENNTIWPDVEAAHRRPDRGAPQLDRVRQLAAAGRATHLSAQRDSRRTVGHRTAGRAQPAGGRRLTGADHGQRAGLRAPSRCWPAPTTARSARSSAPRSRTTSRPDG